MLRKITFVFDMTADNLNGLNFKVFQFIHEQHLRQWGGLTDPIMHLPDGPSPVRSRGVDGARI